LVSEDKAKLGSIVKSLKANANALCGNEALIHNEQRKKFFISKKKFKD